MKRLILIITIMTIGLMLFLSNNINVSAQEIQTVFNRTNVTKVIVKTGVLNVRSGPGKTYKIVSVVYYDQKLNVFGEAWGWYAVELPDYTIGYVSSAYAKPYTPSYTPAPKPPSTPQTPTPSTEVTSEMQQMLNLINQERAKVGVAALKFDAQVNKVAGIKAKEMVEKDYFSHTSPTYGTPFDMLRQFGVSFKSAGENLAGNTSVEAAHRALMNSAGHRQNILNSRYNYIGIGIEPSPKYGKIFVQMFIER